MLKKIFIVNFLIIFICFFLSSAFAEPPLFEIYNTIYGTDLKSDQELEDTYGVGYDETWFETNGHVMASARFAGYTQSFGYYTDMCIDRNQVELFNVTTTGYLYRCSGTDTPCIGDDDCPGGTCKPLYNAVFLIGGGTSTIGFYDDSSGSPPWFSQSVLNSDGKDHMKAFHPPVFDPLHSEYLIAWEDLPGLENADYQDLVLIINYLEPHPLECCKIDDDCDDFNRCTDDACVDSVCQYILKDCRILDDQCNVGACDANSGGCIKDPTPKNDEPCDDSNACTVEDTCLDGICMGGPLNCNDGNVCTDDSCDPNTGCVHTNNTNPCDDGNACTTNDTCSNGICGSGLPPNCDDGNVCTDDRCDSTTGCVHLNNAAPCSDDIFCNGADTCSNGNCSSHSGNPCSPMDICDEEKNICVPPSTSTTTSIPPPPRYKVSILPSSVTVKSDETVAFTAITTRNETVIESSTYSWKILPESTIGSNIDKDTGAYTAGYNDTCSDVTEIIKVTDLDHDVTDTASVMVEVPVCEVMISPSSAMVKSGMEVKFTAVTTCDGKDVEGIYQWEIISTIGSRIDAITGTYTAGNNPTDYDVTDTIRVTDTVHCNNTANVKITVHVKEPPLPPYTISITPEGITLTSLGSLKFSAQTFDNITAELISEEECSYQWEMASPSTIGSTIDGNGLFAAGMNDTGKLITETINVRDIAHDNIPAAATVTILVRAMSIPEYLLPPGPLPTSYRMISIPLWPADGDALRIIKGSAYYNPFLIRLFRWDGQLDEGHGSYREYPDIPKLEPGLGIWAITSMGGFMQVDGTPTDTSQDFTISIPPGWTQIGTPFPFPVEWAQVGIYGGGNKLETPWTFDGIYLPSTILHPWQGYFIYNNSANTVTISIPPQQSSERTLVAATPLSEAEEGWQLKIGVHNVPFFWLQDTYNFIGIAEGSSAEYDPKDLHEPPPISSDQVLLYFPHKWGGKLERYATDFRSLDSTEEVFECTVSPGNGVFSFMKLFWSDIREVPKEYQLKFIDPETGIQLDMREVGEYWFFSFLGADKHFTIIMTRP